MVHANQEAYYQAIAESSRHADSGPFIDFMLDELLKTLKAHQGEERVNVGTNVGANVGTNVGANEERALAILSSMPTITAKEMAQQLGVTARQGERILAVLKQKKLIRREGATKNGRWIVIR